MRRVGFALCLLALSVFLPQLVMGQEDVPSESSESRTTNPVAGSGKETNRAVDDNPAASANLGPEFSDIFAGRGRESRFASSFFQLGSFRMDGLNRGESGYSSYNYFALNYRLGAGETLSFRPVFFFNTPGQDFNGETSSYRTDLGDAYIEYSRNRFARFLGDGSVRLAWRVALPTSQNAKERGMITNVMTYLIITKRLIRKFQVDWHLKPQVYAYDKTGYYVADRDFVRGNQMAAFDHFMDFSYSLSYRWRLSQNFGSEYEWFFPVQSENLRGFRRQAWKYQTAIVCNPTRDLMILAGVQHRRDLDRPRGGFSLFKEDETQVILLSSLRF